MTDYYQSLELPRDATQEQIRRNYRQLALRFHPDRAGPEGAERLKEVQSAYEVLLNPQKRKIYDRFGASFVDNPVSEVLILQLGGRLILCIMACIPFLAASLVVIFAAFLVAYVAGRLVARDAHSVNDHSRAYWNYVKVFSPLLIVDIIIGIPTLVVFFRVDVHVTCGSLLVDADRTSSYCAHRSFACCQGCKRHDIFARRQ
ncbi:putative DnaJ chaperone protein [Trypanosoma cruzi]|nr:putative DnaJ chaperone protein [Trypanosoma cruzi]KAF8283177.1 putative DnaJ chaperone protein [Trypanosoma cruzi]KAF8283178.1 putative DnaJ chaperone protein [Trypanosoma cruzi]KAF8283180.1 putative DnaJ chaperone protein [Trypanosoma cruzi]